MNLTIKQTQRAISACESEIEFFKNKLQKTDSYDTAKTSAEQTELNTEKYLQVLDELFNVMFTLRKEVGSFNSEKINDKSANIAMLEQQIGILNDIQGIGQPGPITSYGSNKTQYRSGYTLDYEQYLRKEIKQKQRKIQSLKDSCAGINASNVIEIDDFIADVLNKYSLIES